MTSPLYSVDVLMLLLVVYLNVLLRPKSISESFENGPGMNKMARSRKSHYKIPLFAMMLCLEGRKKLKSPLYDFEEKVWKKLPGDDEDI